MKEIDEVMIPVFFLVVVMWLIVTLTVPFSFSQICDNQKLLGNKLYYVDKLSPAFHVSCWILQ